MGTRSSALRARANVTLEGDGAATSSRKTLRFDVPPAELYRITEPETLYVQLPAHAVASGHRMLATPELVIFADPGGGTFGGHLAEENGEATLQADGGTNLTLRLAADTWQPRLGQPHLSPADYELSAALLAGLVSAQSEPAGWQAVVQAGLRASHLRRVDDRTPRRDPSIRRLLDHRARVDLGARAARGRAVGAAHRVRRCAPHPPGRRPRAAVGVAPPRADRGGAPRGADARARDHAGGRRVGAGGGARATSADRAVARALIDGIRPSYVSASRGRRSSAPRSAPSTSRARTT